MKKNRAVVFLAWGDHYLNEIANSLHNSKLAEYDKYLLTEHTFADREFAGVKVIGVDFKSQGFIRKSEMLDFVPEGYDSYIFLDSDTKVIGDVSFGFEKAEKYGISLAIEPHYCLDRYFDFGKIMKREGIENRGQLQYNTGVIFFSINDTVRKVFSKWKEFSTTYFSDFNNDQPYFTMALEACSFNPYTLSINYNYRGTGEHISGEVRIWHSHYQMPEQINENVDLWPMRSVYNGKLKIPKRDYWGELNHNFRTFFKGIIKGKN